ncbi:MAG TPA: hypothetical protein DD381_10855 [Lentisphaeria bacterium]|nr:MAG: hypothetical protein A2X47_00745 [Lentisphaerae bacterium GWF2_38_69]HBM16826.1 hypothetical protein [Lentisphaeria bacterium]
MKKLLVAITVISISLIVYAETSKEKPIVIDFNLDYSVTDNSGTYTYFLFIKPSGESNITSLNNDTGKRRAELSIIQNISKSSTNQNFILFPIDMKGNQITDKLLLIFTNITDYKSQIFWCDFTKKSYEEIATVEHPSTPIGTSVSKGRLFLISGTGQGTFIDYSSYLK